MRILFLIVIAVTCLASAGCIAWGGRGQVNNAEHQHNVIMEDQSHAVDHGEYPGDLDHRQQP